MSDTELAVITSNCEQCEKDKIIHHLLISLDTAEMSHIAKNERIEKLQKEVYKHEAEMKDFRERSDNAIKELKETLRMTQDAIQYSPCYKENWYEIEKELEGLKSEVVSIKNKYILKKKELEQKTSEVDAWKARFKNTEVKARQHHIIKKLEEEVVELKEEIQDQLGTINEQEEMLKEFQQEEVDIEKLKKKLAHITASYNSQGEGEAHMGAHIEALQEEVKKLKENNADMGERFAKLMSIQQIHKMTQDVIDKNSEVWAEWCSNAGYAYDDDGWIYDIAKRAYHQLPASQRQNCENPDDNDIIDDEVEAE